MMKKIMLPLLLVCALTDMPGQDRTFNQRFLDAEYLFLTEDYVAAQRIYEVLLTVDPDNANLNFLSGYCLLKTGSDINKAISLLEKASGSVNTSYKEGSYKERNATWVTYFLLARAYQTSNQFDRAIETFTLYSNGIDKKEFAEVQYVNANIQACEQAKSMITHPVQVEFKPVGGNLEFDGNVKNPVVSGNDSILVFITERDNRINIMMSGKENGDWSRALAINPQIGAGKFFPVSLSFDGSELYLVSNDYFNMDIFVSHHEGNRWTLAEKLGSPINTKYVESHACLSKDANRLYFVSDRKGGVGGLDIYVSERIDGDRWGEPVNLGETVNTYYNEETPFLSLDDSRIFFSSQGHNTMGGYDIFYSNLDSGGYWERPVNIGYPINTSGDENFFNPGWEENQALFSMRSETSGENYELYTIRSPQLAMIQGDSDAVSKPGTDATSPETGNEEAVAKAKPAFSSMGIYYILNNILFDFNSWTINAEATRDVDRILVLMRKYPEIKIELTGHTDAIGSSEFNLELSTRRAQTVTDFLTSNGIEPERISVRAAGESGAVAINQYEDGSDAPEGRRLNRHVSIRITNLSIDRIRVAEMFVPDDLVPREDKGYSVLLLQSEVNVEDMPEQFMEEQVSMISTDNSTLYTAGLFDRKTDAVNYLNAAIDSGYPDARIIEQRNLEALIRDNSLSDPYAPQLYTIQFIALKRARDASYFKELPSVIRYECKDGYNRFVTGSYERIEEAQKDLPLIRDKGYENAMIMPVSRYLSMVVDE